MWVEENDNPTIDDKSSGCGLGKGSALGSGITGTHTNAKKSEGRRDGNFLRNYDLAFRDRCHYCIHHVAV